MRISVGRAINQSNSIYNHASNLSDFKKDLSNISSKLKDVWKADEVAIIDNFLDDVIRNITKLVDDMNVLADDIVTTADEIEKEEESRQLAELATLEKRLHSSEGQVQ